VRLTETGIEVETLTGIEGQTATVEGWEVRTPDAAVRLRGARKPAGDRFQPLMQNRPLVPRALAPQVAQRPALDCSLEGFDGSDPLELDHEDQYRRSEEPYPGGDEFSARAYLNWNEEALYLGLEVIKPEVQARDPKTAPLLLDNEPDEIHSDGVQLYLRLPEEEVVYGFLVVPSKDGGLIVRGVADTAGRPEQVTGAWCSTDSGYLLTAAISVPQLSELRPGAEIGFDLLVNRMLPDRTRRAGQLVWSGGGGWVWLRGDRQDPARFGILELA
jgi:Carbohydrate family 9 binding domain-like